MADQNKLPVHVILSENKKSFYYYYYIITPNTDTFYPVRVNQIRWLVILIIWRWNNWMSKVNVNQSFFLYQGFLSQTLTIHLTAGEGMWPSFYSTLPFPLAHEHWDILLATLHVRWLSRIFHFQSIIFRRSKNSNDWH